MFPCLFADCCNSLIIICFKIKFMIAIMINFLNYFIENDGQWPDDILFVSIDSRIVLTGDGIILDGEKLNFMNAGNATHIRGIDIQSGTVNYFVGNSPDRWKTGIPLYRGVKYENLYRGVDLTVWNLRDGQISLQWTVHPGADCGDIEMDVRGDNLVNDILQSVRAYQGADEVEIEIVHRGNTLKFRVGEYDREDTLVIDPIIRIASLTYRLDRGKDIKEYDGYIYVVGSASADSLNVDGYLGDKASWKDGLFDVIILKVERDLSNVVGGAILGGSDYDYGFGIAISSDGVYLTGRTSSDNFPTTPGAHDRTYNGNNDVFISKLSLDLSNLLASTYLGGSNYDYGYGIAISSDGVYVMGYTGSSNFPTRYGAYDRTFNGNSDVFISKLSLDLRSLLSSTYLGGNDYDRGYDIALSSDGVYVVGNTRSSDFPTTSGAYDETHNGGSDAFISKLSLDLSSLLASTYLGGRYNDYGHGIALSADEVYVVGEASSNDFPTTPGAYNETYNGQGDVFISKLSLDLSNIVASTYLGGRYSDYGYRVYLIDDGIYVVGFTQSVDFPTTSGAYDETYNGNDDIFISRLSLDLSNLLASTYLGGRRDEYSEGIAVSSDGVYVTGYTYSNDFPATPGAYDIIPDDYSNAFISKLSLDLIDLVSGTFLDRAVFNGDYDYLADLSLYGGNVYAVGYVNGDFLADIDSSNFGYSDRIGGYKEIVILMLDGNLNILSVTYLGGSRDDYGEGIAVSSDGVYVTGYTFSNDFPTTPGAYDETYNGNGYLDVFVSKLSLDLSSLLASTYLEGDNEDKGYGLALSSDGVYVVGRTSSYTFPTTPGAYDTTSNGSGDVFISKLSLDLSGLSASTLLGGGNYDHGYGIALSSDGIYVVGYTNSSDFPTTSGVYNETYIGGIDVFVSKLSPDLSSLSASTYLGGSSYDYGKGIVLSSDGVYVVGETSSSDFPTTSGVYDETYNGNRDAFISKLSLDLSSLSAGTYLGGNNDDYGEGIDLSANKVYVVGYTNSSNFPTTPGAYDETYNGNSDAFISRLSSDLNTLESSTYLGGNSVDYAYTVFAPYNSPVIYVCGQSDSLGYLTGWKWRDGFITTMLMDLTPVALDEGDWNWRYEDGRLIVELQKAGYVGLNIYDVRGRLVRRRSPGFYPGGILKVGLDGLEPSTYVILLRVGDEVKKLKIVKIK